MATDYFLKIDGIPGESTDEEHKGEIEVLAWSWGEANPCPPAAAGARSRSTTSRSARGSPRRAPRSCFSKIQVTYKQQAPSGKLGNPVAVGWDVKQGKQL